ncbi:MAG UNVERIFIED_CONTAM: hypothetical protein LVR29_21725 [Microcystis novacekii LVE1205-3]|jgi:hypothetical protein
MYGTVRIAASATPEGPTATLELPTATLVATPPNSHLHPGTNRHTHPEPFFGTIDPLGAGDYNQGAFLIKKQSPAQNLSLSTSTA